MPIVILRYKMCRGLKELAENLTKELPNIIASNMSISCNRLNDGNVTPEDIIVQCTEGGGADVNNQDIEIVIFAHDFPERKANLEERKSAIIEGVRKFLTDYDRNVTGFVWILLQPSAFGKL